MVRGGRRRFAEIELDRVDAGKKRESLQVGRIGLRTKFGHTAIRWQLVRYPFLDGGISDPVDPCFYSRFTKLRRAWLPELLTTFSPDGEHLFGL
jgi:hypothetical protein